MTLTELSTRGAQTPLPAPIVTSVQTNPMPATTYQTNLTDRTYNGWTNYETWNVVLWIENDEGIYTFIRENDICCYEDLLEAFYEFGTKETPDGVKWNDPKINRAEINGDVFDF